MPSFYWIKLYHEILDDPKMGKLSDRLWRRTIELFLLAGDADKNGELPKLDDIAWRLRLSPEFLESDLVELAKVGIVSHSEGRYSVTNFNKRQTAASNAERQAQYRERLRKEEYYNNEGVTGRYTDIDKNRIDKIRVEEDIDKQPPPSDSEKVRRAVGQMWGSGDEPQMVDDLIDDFGMDKVMEIAGWCNKQKMRSMRQAIKSIRTAAPGWKTNSKESTMEMLDRQLEELGGLDYGK